MTKTESAQLIKDVGIIKQALIKSDFGPGLIQEHSETKARTYENKRAIAKFQTVVYTVGGAATLLGTIIAMIKNWNSIF